MKKKERPVVNQEIDFMEGECIRCGCKETEMSTAHPCKCECHMRRKRNAR